MYLIKSKNSEGINLQRQGTGSSCILQYLGDNGATSLNATHSSFQKLKQLAALGCCYPFKESSALGRPFMTITTLLPSVRTCHCSMCFVPSKGILSLGFLTDPNYKFTALSHTGICSRNKLWKKSGMSKVEYKLYNSNFGKLWDRDESQQKRTEKVVF